MNEDRKQNLTEFVAWVREHITGDEKGEAQIFLDRLFKAFELKGVREAGAILEMRVKKRDEGGTAFADLVYKPIVLIEMKKRGTDLRRHYRQAFDYWVQLAPNRPKYVILCNFDEFWIYDFDSAQYDEPLDKLPLDELPNRWGPLAFLFRTRDRPTFGNDHEQVTRNAADLLADVFSEIEPRVGRPLAQRFILQLLVALFAEDIDLLPKYFVTQLLEDCKTKAESYDLLGGLFIAMNTPGKSQGGRFKGVDYFNGGLFAEPARIELEADELARLRTAAKGDWSKVRPEIFGTLFEHSLGTEDRRASGAHFTHPVDIMKIVGPTIVEPWRAEIARAKSRADILKLLERLAHYTVLDPACGSGNFLYTAYRELKRLEAQLTERLETEFAARGDAAQKRLGFVTARQFYGLDINPFAVELAKVTMMIARKLAIDELHVSEQPLPLDNLDQNFIACDALFAEWPRADVIIGNPPFIGAKLMKPQLGADYVNLVREAYPDVPGMADYCVYWLRKAHDHLSECTKDDPVAGRAGLVGTQNIRNNQSRVGGLDYIASSGTIIEAVDNQPWSGEANVHVSIVNWVKMRNGDLPPSTRRLWTQLNKSGTKNSKRRRAGENGPSYDLVFRDVPFINSSLSDETDVSGKVRLSCNLSPKRCFQGKIPGYEGFLLDRDTANRLRLDSGEVIFPYLTGREMLDEFRIERWVIDFANRDMIDASSFRSAFAHCKQYVLPAVEQSLRDAESADSDMGSARKEHLGRWWQLWNRRDELSAALAEIPRYIGCSRVTRRPIMVFLSSGICPSDLVQVFALSDDYSFGILQSALHFEWFRKSSRMKVESDTRYSVRDVFETFPWPQSPTVGQVEAVASAAQQVREVRSRAIRAAGGGLRDLYRAIELSGKHPLRTAHEELDDAVRQAYGMARNAEELAFLFEVNRSVDEAIKAGKVVERPGLPSCIADCGLFVSQDCFSA